MRDSNIDINTNPMRFEDLATSLATLGSYARDDIRRPLEELDHLYRRSLCTPPGYSEITSLTGHSLTGRDVQSGRSAWLLANVEGLKIYSVHSQVWHRLGDNYYAPVLEQMKLALGTEQVVLEPQTALLGTAPAIVDVVGVKDDCIWLVQVVSNTKCVDSALKHMTYGNDRLFRGTVFENAILDAKGAKSLQVAKMQMAAAFPNVDVFTFALVLHPKGPDFELYQVDLPERPLDSYRLEEGKIRRNSIDHTDQISHEADSLFSLRDVLNSPLFIGIPPCRGGRTLGTLASAVTRQMASDKLLTWRRQDFLSLLKEDFNYHVEQDKLRHDLDTRLTGQGFFRKWGPDYYVSTKGVARYVYCLAKFTSLGTPIFDLDLCVAQRDKILERFGCVS